ncbi:MAG: hypothetical protein ACSLE8_00695 [Rhodococcus sp. (in: high G+C Gram-positive bacteria)]
MSEGRIALWRYRENRRNYPGYHMTCDAVGGEWLAEQIRKLRPGKTLQVSLTPVTDEILSVPANWSPAVGFNVWHITFDSSIKTLVFSEAHPRCHLSLPPESIPDLSAGISSMVAGKGDYAIGETDQQELWFWWWPVA